MMSNFLNQCSKFLLTVPNVPEMIGIMTIMTIIIIIIIIIIFIIIIIIATGNCVTFFVKMVGNLLFMFCVLVHLAVSKRTFMND